MHLNPSYSTDIYLQVDVQWNVCFLSGRVAQVSDIHLAALDHLLNLT